MYNVTYLYHSGFLVETENYYLIFDYYTKSGKYNFIQPKKLNNKKVIVFASHFHQDHFDKTIFEWEKELPQIQYILSNDIFKTKKQENMLMVAPNKEYQLENILIKTFLSNDSGVAFLVNVDGINIYHAGDLNWWHWNEESDTFNKEIALSYKKEIDQMKGNTIDIAFVPVDLRLEENYLLGIDYLMKKVNTIHVFPMHFWDKYEVFNLLEQDERAKVYKNKIEKIEKVNQKFKFD